jgi:beta-phosphoglucomutase
MPQKAFLFDLNGTMIDDMQYHINAWHKILNELGATISLEQTKAECYGKNAELLQRIFPDRFTTEEVTALSIAKETQYQKEFLPHLKLIDGLDHFLQQAAQHNIKMAIGSAAIMYNIDFVIDGLNLHHYINAIVSADDVNISKPHPETFVKCATQLQVDAKDCRSGITSQYAMCGYYYNAQQRRVCIV